MTEGGSRKSPSKSTKTAASDSAISKILLKWYRVHRRDLPWRHSREPYRVWVSEIMLQQTRVAAVIPYYERFLDRFPNIAKLAAAPEEDLLAVWSGLGYYRRARQMQTAARTVMEKHGGELPGCFEALRALSGIGDYTAAAISSIAFGSPHAVLDGNVMRVLTRLDDNPSNISSGAARKVLQRRAQQLLEAAPHTGAGDFNQALMELGATVCTPHKPDCQACPLKGRCEARRAGTVNERPVNGRAERTERLEIVVAIVRRGGSLLMRQRPKDSAVMPGFWELPEAQGRHLDQNCFADLGIEIREMAGKFRHGITFRSFRGKVYIGSLPGAAPKGYRWIAERKRPGLPLTTVTKKALAAV